MDAAAIPPDTVASNNPPGFFLATERPSVVIPFGGPEVLREVTARYDVRWVVLDANHPQDLEALYQSPAVLNWLELKAEFQDSQARPVWLFAVHPESE